MGFENVPEVQDKKDSDKAVNLGFSPVIAKALEKLPEKQKLCLLMREMDDFNYEDITKALKKMAKKPAPPSSFDQTWFKIEERLEARKNHFWNHIVWNPWGHPVRWVVATACLCLFYTGVSYRQNVMDQTDMGSYLISVANPTTNVTKELGVEKVSVLLSESTASTPDVKVDDHLEPIAADEILL